MLADHACRCLLAAALLFSLSIAAEAGDYDRALDAYEDEDYAIARMYLKRVLSDSAAAQFHPDALFYLAKIHEYEDDFLSLLDITHRFVNGYPYDARASDILRTLLDGLIARQAYVLAVDFVKQYSHLVRDESLFERLGHGLLKQGERSLADSMFALCPQNDTIKIIRAFLIDDFAIRETIFKTLQTRFRDLYLAENHLLQGDTVDGFLAFRELDQRDLSVEALYRYSKIALNFDRDIVRACAEKLVREKQYEGKAKLIQALAECRADFRIGPSDGEELALFMQVCGLDTVSTMPPEDLMLDSVFAETVDTTAFLQDLRERYDNTYYLDSLYCQRLILLGRYDDAARAISYYLRYCNTRDYVRKVLGIQHFASQDYRRAAEHLITSGYHTPSVQYMLGECLRNEGYEASDFYETVMAETADSVLYLRALSGFIQDRYDADDFPKVCSFSAAELPDDTSLIRIYVRSLARCGEKTLADSILIAHSLALDPVTLNYYGLYLIDQERFAAAGSYFDSLMQTMGIGSDELYYNWALTAFLNNEMETAIQRFTSYLSDHPKGSRQHDVFFKIATLNYLKENYDSAAYYYGLASRDSDLVADALMNQLISYKKAGDWPGVIRAGQEILASGIDLELADVHFDIGYAYLRAAKIRQAIENLVVATRLRSDPRFHYWLGEAYLSKGDFARAFYSYQKVVDRHADDEMWAPTAQYKTGIVLELMDETEAARAVYEKIIRQRGAADPIASEAQIRLKEIEP